MDESATDSLSLSFAQLCFARTLLHLVMEDCVCYLRLLLHNNPREFQITFLRWRRSFENKLHVLSLTLFLTCQVARPPSHRSRAHDPLAWLVRHAVSLIE